MDKVFITKSELTKMVYNQKSKAGPFLTALIFILAISKYITIYNANDNIWNFTFNNIHSILFYRSVYIRKEKKMIGSNKKVSESFCMEEAILKNADNEEENQQIEKEIEFSVYQQLNKGTNQ